MAFPKHHGIELAKNSWIKNLRLEPLAADPVGPLEAGRAWHNTTEKVFKYTVEETVDLVTSVVVRTISTTADVQAAITSLTTAINNGDAAEAAARTTAINSLTDALAAETANRINGDSTEAQARIDGIAAEAAARTAADAVVAQNAADALATETTARLAGDAAGNTRMDAIQGELDVTQAAAGLNVDGTYTAPLNTTNLGAVTSLKAADVALDLALTNEVTRATNAEAAINSALANEAQLRADGDANLQAQLTEWVNTQLAGNEQSDIAETNARIAADAALQAELDQTQASIGLNTDGTMGSLLATNFMSAATTVFGAAFALDNQLKVVTDGLANEASARQTADDNFHTQLQAETTARQTADLAQQAEIDAIEAGAGLETNGTFLAPVGSNFLNAATSLKDADVKLDSALKAVSDRIGVVETTSIPGLTQQIADEVTRATAAEAANATAISNEVTRATTTDADLQAQINSLSAASGDGAAALKTKINARIYTFKSSVAATEHVITHNLNTEFYAVSVMVEGSDGVYRNDILPVEEDAAEPLNKLVLTLTDAANVKVVVENKSPIA